MKKIMHKINWYRVIFMTMVGIVCMYGVLYWIFNKDTLGYINYRSSLLTETPIPTIHKSKAQTDDSKTTTADYINKKYNFVVTYKSEFFTGGRTYTKGWIEEINNQIIYKEIRLDDSHYYLPEIYTLYGANSNDKKNLALWWKNNIKTDIGGGKVPNDYSVETDVAKLLWHPDRVLEHWDNAPPGIFITLNESAYEKLTLEPGANMLNSVYLYYDFGTPFIVQFEVGNSGAGATPGIFSYIRKYK